jgi:hypothetical protein
MISRGNKYCASRETKQSKFERREAEIGVAMQQEADRRAAAVKNMHRLRALRLSIANRQVLKTREMKDTGSGECSGRS